MTTKTRPKRPRDPNQLAKMIVDIATCEVEDALPDGPSADGADVVGRKGGLKEPLNKPRKCGFIETHEVQGFRIWRN